MSKTLHQKLANIQQNLVVKKGQFNKFGGYAFRSSEDILEAVKPLLGDLTLKVEEKMFVLSAEGESRFYKRATAILSDGESEIAASAEAREDDSQKGMSSAQLSGSVGSYAKKYALGNLFAIDDTKDADATNTHGKEDKPAPEKPKVVDQKAPESFKRKPKAVSAAKPSEDTEDDY